MSEQTKQDVVILGGRVAAMLAAAYLRLHVPELSVTVIGRTDKELPMVGESTIEGTTLFLIDCGLQSLLHEHHHKYGLTFYFKMDRDPGDRRYSIHEEPAIPPLPAALLNRWSFDRDLREHIEQLGAQRIEGVVTDAELGRDGHTVTYLPDGSEETRTLRARYVIDATGRSRFLAKKLGVGRKPQHQRCSFWFRLKDFDRSILLDLNRQMRRDYPCMREQMAYDPYFVTHHFMGEGNWIWLIPAATEDDSELISVGIVWRPDLYDGDVRNMEDFLRQVRGEHPVIADLVESGTVHDTNLLSNYMYHSEKIFSDDGWFLIGDAANATDPLYSSGLFLVAIQVTQIAELLKGAQKGRPDGALVRTFNELYETLYSRSQTIVAEHYEVMSDPWQSSLRMHWLTSLYFHFLLPWFMSGYHKDPIGAKLMRKVMADAEEGERSAWPLFERAAAAVDAKSPSEIFNYYNDSINYRLLTARERDLPAHLAKLSFLLARIRYDSMKRSGFWDKRRQFAALTKDLSTGALLSSALKGKSLKNSELFRRIAGID